MRSLSRKFIAVLLMLWLPVFGGSALAATVSMQLGHGNCQQQAMPQSAHHHHMSTDTAHHHAEAPSSQHHTAPACDNCEVCHLVGTGYLGMADIAVPALQPSGIEATPYLVAFSSHTSAPLVPPPLVRA